MINQFCGDEGFIELKKISTLDYLYSSSIPCFIRTDDHEVEISFPSPINDNNNITNSYLLDAASVMVTDALEIEDYDRILDLCSAPGGKAIAIIQKIFFTTQENPTTTTNGSVLENYLTNRKTPNNIFKASLVCNDVSPQRNERLKATIYNFVPKSFRECISISQRDATSPTAWSAGTFTKIIVDAPCSSERHLLHNSKELEKWGQSRSRQNAERQLSILKNAFNFLTENGVIVYITCSISTLENDGLIKKIIKKSKWEITVQHKQWKFGEPTEHGWQILPDKCEGWGPLYFTILKKGILKEEKKTQPESTSLTDSGDEAEINDSGDSSY